MNTPSPEMRALLELVEQPAQSRPGDLWRCNRLGFVILTLGGAKRRGNKYYGFNYVALYHWHEPSLRLTASQLFHGSTAETIRDISKSWVYVGNIFKLLPAELLMVMTNNGVENV